MYVCIVMKIIGFLGLIIIGFGCVGEGNNRGNDIVEPSDSLQFAEIKFDTTVHNLGTIREGEQVIAWFEYENTGKGPLLIKDIKAGCGCTLPEWSKLPLEPGEEESIKVIFDSNGKAGIQTIPILVVTNARNPRIELRLESVVKRMY